MRTNFIDKVYKENSVNTAAANAGQIGLSRWQKLAGWFIIWTSLSLIQAARLHFVYNPADKILYDWPIVIAWSFAEWYLWGLLSIIIYRITVITGFDRSRWWRYLLIHTFFALAIIIIHLSAYVVLHDLIKYMLIQEHSTAFENMRILFLNGLRTKIFHGLLTYFLIAFVCYAIDYYWRYRNEEIRLARLETELVTAQMKALKSQLQPHFLFNTLNSISALVYSDPEIADKMIARLSELLRISLEYENINEIELKKELDFTDGYIEIQQIRFDNKLKISKDINPQAYDALVPSFIVQPLVENSIRHGFMKFENADNIFISSSIRGNKLKLVVADKGPGIAKNWNIENYGGHSLYNMKQRMSQLYGSDYRFEIANGLNGGLTVTIEIPYNLAGAK